MDNFRFNMLSFEHPMEKLTLYFSNEEENSLFSISARATPDKVKEHFGKQERYFVLPETAKHQAMAITMNTAPEMVADNSDIGHENLKPDYGHCFSSGLLKKYYNYSMHAYFEDRGYILKPNFIHDVDLWLYEKQDKNYEYYNKFCLRADIRSIPQGPVLILIYKGCAKVLKKSYKQLSSEVPGAAFCWMKKDKKLFRIDQMPEHARQAPDKVFPVWNLELASHLNLDASPPAPSNKYRKQKNKLQNFIQNHLSQAEFHQRIKLKSYKMIKIDKELIRSVSDRSNRLLFGNSQSEINPYQGLKKFGPYKTSPISNIQFFFIAHSNNKNEAMKIHHYFEGSEKGFNGLINFIKTPYHTKKNFSIFYNNKTNPLPEIEQKLAERTFSNDTRYICIYLSPYEKTSKDKEQRNIYHRVKELLLHKNISSQVLDINKINKDDYFFSMPNIATAILAKADGIPWRLDRDLNDELVIGVGAFKHRENEQQYIGSAISFRNNGRFRHFECFRKSQTSELAGSIIDAVKAFSREQQDIKKLVIHFYKNMSHKELRPIEQGLRNIGLDIPIYIVTINKSESSDIIAFDQNSKTLMPESGTYIKIGWNKFLLYNNTLYDREIAHKTREGFPFPLKIKIECNRGDEHMDISIVKTLLDQVYQFSRLYWKSVSQQALPVTIKYPEMIAEIFPYFEGNEIPGFGKENLWFL